MLTPQQFLAEEKALRAEHEQEYSVFKEVPEMHPDYETKYEQFMTSYRQRAAGSQVDPALEESSWTAYWAEEFDKLKQQEWEAKRKQLVAKYKEVLTKKKKTAILAKVEQSHREPSVPVPGVSAIDNDSVSSDSVLMQSLAYTTSAVDPDILTKADPNSVGENVMYKKNFSFESAFEAIEDLCDTLGLLGTAFKGLLNIARDRGLQTPEGLRTFTDADNVTLIKMIIEKWREQAKTSTPSMSERLHKAMTAAEGILKEAERRLKSPPESATSSHIVDPIASSLRTSETKGRASSSVDSKGPTPAGKIIMDDIDMDLIAKATFGKNPGEILNFINNTLAYEGITVNNEELTAIYLSISASHMTMSLQKQTSSSTLAFSPVSYASSMSTAPPTASSKPSYSSSRRTEETYSSFSTPLKLASSSQTANNILMASMSESLDDTYIPGLTANITTLGANKNKSSVNSGITIVSSSGNGMNHNYPPVSTKPSYTVSSTYGSTQSMEATHSQLKKDNQSPKIGNDDSWFVLEVKTALSDPNITIELFNKQLATIFANKPRNYQFSTSDLNLASKLQQLGTSNYSGEAFISALKAILNV